MSNNKIDIMLISETHFTEKSYVKLKNYELYSTNHPAGTARGGTAVIINNNIKHSALCGYKTPHIQATSVSVHDTNGPVTITSLYSPPRHSIHSNQYSDFFKSLGHKFIVGGDFNAKHSLWGSHSLNPKGRELFKSIQINRLQQISTGEPTYWPSDINKRPDVIDFCISKGIPSSIVKAESCFDLSSDHSPIIITIASKTIQNRSQPKIHAKNTNWELFKEMVQKNLPLQISLKSGQDINKSWMGFNSGKKSKKLPEAL